MKNYITRFNGEIIGWTEDFPDKILLRNFKGQIIGIYDKRSDTTREFSGRIIARGNQLGMLLNKN